MRRRWQQAKILFYWTVGYISRNHRCRLSKFIIKKRRILTTFFYRNLRIINLRNHFRILSKTEMSQVSKMLSSNDFFTRIGLKFVKNISRESLYIGVIQPLNQEGSVRLHTVKINNSTGSLLDGNVITETHFFLNGSRR